AGVATVVWPALANATSYAVTSDDPAQQASGATCAAGVCSLRLQAQDGTSTIGVSASNAVGTALIANGTTDALTGAPAAPDNVAAYSQQYGGVVYTTFHWTGSSNTSLAVRELDPATGELTTRFADYIYDYDPFCFECYTPTTGCSTFDGCHAQVASLPAGQRIFQLEITGTQPTARSLPIVVVVPSLDTTPPPAPTNLRITGVTTTTATLAWDRSPATDVSYYVLTASLSFPERASVSATSCNATTCTGTVSNLYPGIDIPFSVRAYDAASNESPASNVVHGVCGTALPIPTPTIMSLTPDDNMLELRFEDPALTADTRVARYHVWYTPTAGGAEQDAGVLAGSCFTYNKCRMFIQGLTSIPYSVQVQAEGSPGNFSARSDAWVATPAPRAPDYPDTSSCYNGSITRIRMYLQPKYDPAWFRLPWAPDVVSFKVVVHATFLITDANGVWQGQTRTQDFATTFSRSAICADDLDCTAIVSFPDGAYIPDTSAGASAIDAAGNESPAYPIGIGYPGSGSCLQSNF
ncbi:MAG TPA: fibronectin type III domain-containing protein, partial [Kofleriaceae bacterium]|nr:fibronectin type III domain-containing protein [Kofleriaceae bacterium]